MCTLESGEKEAEKEKEAAWTPNRPTRQGWTDLAKASFVYGETEPRNCSYQEW